MLVDLYQRWIMDKSAQTAGDDHVELQRRICVVVQEHTIKLHLLFGCFKKPFDSRSGLSTDPHLPSLVTTWASSDSFTTPTI